jgi:hypothetical protein
MFNRAICDAQAIYATLTEARLPYYEKVEVRGRVCDESGDPLRYNGTITLVRPSYAFVQCEAPRLRVFVPLGNDSSFRSDDLIIGFPVSFELAFNLRGPIALNLTLT